MTGKYTYGEVATTPGVGSGHRVLGVEHLLGELWNEDGAVLLAPTNGQGGIARHEEVETWKGGHVDGQLPQVRVELTWEAQAGRDIGHDDRHEVAEVIVCRGCQLEGTEADIVQCLVLDAEGLVRVLDELLD